MSMLPEEAISQSLTQKKWAEEIQRQSSYDYFYGQYFIVNTPLPLAWYKKWIKTLRGLPGRLRAAYDVLTGNATANYGEFYRYERGKG